MAYDDSDATIAARLWWLFRYHGHWRVRVLDGGFAAWAAYVGSWSQWSADPGRPVATGEARG